MISWFDFVNFIKPLNIIDKKVPLSTIDRIYIQTNKEASNVKENSDTHLCRYEFFEILVRIAGVKYKD